jgi:hypothetical protein
MYRDLLLVVHIASVAAWLGCNFTQLFLGPWFARRGGEVAAAWYDAASRLASRYYNVAGTLLAVSGVLLVLKMEYAWSAGFVGVGITVVIIGGVLGTMFFAPTGKRLADLARDGDDAARRSLDRRYLAVACLDTLLVLAAVLAMVKRWNA